MMTQHLIEMYEEARAKAKKEGVKFEFFIRARLQNKMVEGILISRIDGEKVYGHIKLVGAMKFDPIEEILNPESFMSFAQVQRDES